MHDGCGVKTWHLPCLEDSSESSEASISYLVRTCITPINHPLQQHLDLRVKVQQQHNCLFGQFVDLQQNIHTHMLV